MSKNQPELPAGVVDVAGLGAPRQPQVNLLPPEIRAKRSLGRVKAWLAVALLAVLLIAAAGVVLSMVVENRAAAELQLKQDDIARLQAEQTRYAEVPRIKGQIRSTEEARDIVMAAEVLWPQFLGAVQATIPENVRLMSLNTALPGPAVPPTPSANPLDPAAVGSVSFTGRASLLPDLALWMDQLVAIPGVVGVTFDSADFSDDEGVYAYDITVAIQVDATVYAHQYSQTEEVE